MSRPDGQPSPALPGRAGAAALAAGCALTVVAAHVYIASLSRVMADTYCYAGDTRALGLVPAMQHWYRYWTGRYSFNLAESLLGYVSPPVVTLLPVAVMGLWCLALAGALWQLRLGARRGAELLATGLLSALILSATLSDSPRVVESVYWSSGLDNYTLPLLVATLYAGLFFYVHRRPRLSGRATVGLAVLGAALAFVGGGFSEMYGALQAATLAALLAAALLAGGPARRGRLAFNAAALLGSLAALAVVIAAPGNQGRQAFFPPTPAPLPLLALAVSITGGFLNSAVANHPLSLAGVALLAGWLGAGGLEPGAPARYAPRQLVRFGLWLPVITYGLLVGSFAAAAFGLSGPPPGRAVIVPEFVLVSALAAWAYAAGALLRRADLGALLGREARGWQALLAVAVVAWGAGRAQAAQQALSQQPVYSTYAAAWDAQDRLLTNARSAGLHDVAEPPLRNPAGLIEAGTDPSGWFNLCVADFYGLHGVAATPPLPAPSAAETQRLTPLDARLGDAAQVDGFALDRTTVRAGQTLSLTVYWRPQAVTAHPYTVFVHLYDPATGSLAQVDTYPAQGKYPTTLWVYDHPFADTYRLAVPAALPAAHEAEIVLGLYDLQTLQRLPVTGRDAEPDQAWVRVARVTVTP